MRIEVEYKKICIDIPSWYVGVLKPDAFIQQYQAQGTCSVNLYRMCEVFIESVKQLWQLIYALES